MYAPDRPAKRHGTLRRSAGWRLSAVLLLAGTCLAGPAAAQDTYRDNFSTAAYNVNNGSQNFSTNWQETNDDGLANSGRIDISGGELRMKHNSTSTWIRIEREANLSSAALATLRLSWRVNGNVGGGSYRVQIHVSANGGSNWTLLEELNLGGGSGSPSYDLTPYLATNTRIRFSQTGSWNGQRQFFVDFAEIAATDDPGVCYTVADGGDRLTRIWRGTGGETDVGAVGVPNIEANAYWPGTHTLFAADAGQLGTLDFTGSGAFTATSSAFGSGNGTAGSITFSDVDALSFDPFTGFLYGAHRRSGSDDVLLRIDPATGARVPDAFGPGVDYVVINTTAVVGFPDIDDFAIDAYDGQLYGIANNGGSGDRLVRINKATGAVTDVGPLAQNDMEGLTFDGFGQLYGTTGNGGGATSDSFHRVNKSTGVATPVSSLSVGTDYESLACLTDGVNDITGTVFRDNNEDTVYQPGTDQPRAGVTVELYRDVNGNGQVDIGTDILVATQETGTDGGYGFTIAAEGDLVMRIDTGDLPAGATLTTDNVEAASFTGFGNTDAGNDFGFRSDSSDVCYAVADGGDRLSYISRSTGGEIEVGPVGVPNVETIAYWPGTHTLYAANAGQLGTLDFTGSGAFTATSSAFGSGNGTAGSITFSDVDALSFDPFTGFLYGAHRRSGSDDVLLRIDPATGAHVPNAFGPGVDYVVINTTAVVGFPDIDDFAIDAYDGQLYGIANNGGTGDRLVRINKATGAVTDVGALGVNDMEGLTFDGFGQLYGTAGTGGTPTNSYFTVNKNTGAAALVANLGVGTDYESVACLTDGVNDLTGTVFRDNNEDGVYQSGYDSGTGGVTVELYRDVNGNGQVDIGTDVLVTTQQTAGDGSYGFTVAAEGNFVTRIDTGDLPGDATLTTDNVEAASFTGFGNTDPNNNFGYTRPIDLALTHTVDKPSPNIGEQVTFTVTLTNEGLSGATGVQVADFLSPLPAGLSLVSVTPSVGSYDSGTGLWTVGSFASGASATLTVIVQVNAEGDYNSCAEVAVHDQTDSDSTPYNDTGEDDYECVSISTTGSSGGGTAGLESDGTLAGTLAQVLYNRRLDPALRPAVPSFLLRTNASPRAAKTQGSFDLVKDIIPATGPEESLAREVSPADLLPVTNADGLFAVDYLRGDQRRVGAVFAALTAPGTLYEHTKVVCDRLRGAALEGVEPIDLAGHPFLLARLRHDDGSFDYALSFVVYPREGRFEIDSRFRLDEYAVPEDGGEIINVQVWSVSKAYTLAMAEEVLARLAMQQPLAFQNTKADPPRLPQVYVRRGVYAQGRLTLEVQNAAGAQTLRLTGGTLARSESAGREQFEMTLALPKADDGKRFVEVEVPVGPVFDAAFFVETDGETGRDQLYLADGAWSYTFDGEGAGVETFDVLPEAAGKAPEAGKRRVERDVHLRGAVRTWAALFRYLQPGGQPLDLSDHQYVEFTAHGRGQARLYLEKAGLAEEHFSTIVKLTAQPQRHRVWFDDLRRFGRNGFTAEDLIALSIYVIGEQGRTRPFEITLEDITFGGATGDVLAEVPDAFELEQNYPNPFNPTTTLAFGLPEARHVRLTVYDMMGRRVGVLADRVFDAGRHQVPFEARGLASGVYLYRLELGDRVLSNTMVLSK